MKVLIEVEVDDLVCGAEIKIDDGHPDQIDEVTVAELMDQLTAVIQDSLRKRGLHPY